MKLLGLDSSGLVASVAVVADDDLLGEYTVNYKKTHSDTENAIAGGPGSFTGLRIGSATAKGLGLALDKPIVSVPTVEALAYNLVGHRDIVCPLMDARRDQTYTGLYRFSGNALTVLREQCAIGIEEIVSELNQRGETVVFLGDGVLVFREYLKEKLCVPYSFAPAHLNKQRAGAVAARGLCYLKEGRIETAEQHKPEYLRLSQAERERSERQKIEV